MFYLMMHSTHFLIYGYMVKNHSDRKPAAATWDTLSN